MFAACFIAYSASYVGRINFSAALPAIVSTGLFTKPEAGMIGSAFFIVYGAFQIINGILGDRLSPFKMVSVGTFLSFIANLIMPLCKTNTAMAFIWGFNGFALSLLWAAILKILANIINDDMRSRACLNISATLPIGTIAAYLLASLSIKFLSWKFVFTISAFVLLFASVFFTVSYLKVKPHITMREVKPLKAEKEGSSLNKMKLLPLIAAAGIFFILPADAIHGAIKEGITTWVPTMLTEVYNTSASFSVFLTIALPIFNITGVYIITPIYKKLFKENEMKTGTAVLIFTLIPLSLLIFMRWIPVYMSIILLAMVTTAMHTFNYLIITLVPMRFASIGKTATITGIMNATAYIGSASSSYGFGIVSENIGWNGTIFVWLGLNVLALAAAAFSIHRWTNYKRSLVKNECV